MTETISKKEIDKIAQLARIDLQEEEKHRLAGDLSGILEYFQGLNKVADYSSKVEVNNLKENNLREDEIKEVSDKEKERIKKLFPQSRKDQLSVKNILK